MKLQNNVGHHKKGDPYPEHDFSALDGLDLSWVSPAACISNKHVANYLQNEYNRNSKLTSTVYFYYTVYNEETENTCTATLM